MEKKNVLTNFTGIALMGATLAFSPVLIDDVSANAGPGAPTGETSSGESNSSNGSSSNVEVTVEDQESNSNSSESSGALLSQGDQGDAVVDLQTKLQKAGYSLAVDGSYGPETQEKIVAFQLNQGWSGDGIFGNPTSNALDAAVASSNGNNNSNGNSDGGSVQEDTDSAEPIQISTGNDSGNANSGDAVATAESLVGSPYVAGGTTPSGFDSSGFINYVFNQQGKSLNRTHAGMWANDGQHVDSPSVGDVVFFENTYKSGVSHSGIYIGNNQMIHAGTPETGVEITTPSAWEYYWADRYIGAKRF